MTEKKLAIHHYIFLYICSISGLLGLFFTELLSEEELLLGLVALHLGVLLAMHLSPNFYRIFRIASEVFAYEVVIFFIYLSVKQQGEFPLYIGKILFYLFACYILRIFQGRDLLLFLSWPLATGLYLASISTFPRTGLFLVVLAILLIFLTIGGEFTAFASSLAPPISLELRLGWNLALWGILFSLLGFLLLQYFSLPSFSLSLWGKQKMILKQMVSLQNANDISPLAARYSGFSPYLQLASGEQIHQSVELALRVRTFFPGYFRGVVFTEYTGRGWRVPPAFQTEFSRVDRMNTFTIGDMFTTEIPFSVPVREVVQVYTMVKQHPNILFHFYKPVEVRFDAPQYAPYLYVVQDEALSLRSSFLLEPDLRYRVVSIVPQVFAEMVAEWEEPAPEFWEEGFGPYLSLPAIPKRISALARREAGSGSVSRRVSRLVEFLNTQYAYTLDVPKIPQERDAIDFFLFESRRGYCEYFASALAVMLRSLGIPARVVGGYRGGKYDVLTGEFLLYDLDAHTFVEYYVPGMGWMIADPTPDAVQSMMAGDPRAVPIRGSVSSFAPGMYTFNRFSYMWALFSVKLSDWLTPWTVLSRRVKILLVSFVLLLFASYFSLPIWRYWWKNYEQEQQKRRQIKGRMLLLLSRLERLSRLPRHPAFTLTQYRNLLHRQRPQFVAFSSEFFPVLEQVIYNEQEFPLDRIQKFEVQLDMLRRKKGEVKKV